LSYFGTVRRSNREGYAAGLRLSRPGICSEGMTPKQRAAEAAISFLKDGMVVGLGTGSTADYFLQALAGAIRDKKLRDIRGVPTSKQSQRRAEHLGIPLVNLAQHPLLDVTVDGADEVDPHMNLIKGLGGALLREKIVAQNSKLMIVIADTSKAVSALGTKSPLPVEVTVFGHELQEGFLRSLGANPVLRKTTDAIYTTDNGNYIYDCHFERIEKPADLEHKLKQRAGIVETGLFIGMAKVALIADENKVEERR
jgi:ribose 5-phosphate isomerase A